MLVLRAQLNQKITLHDTKSGSETTVRLFRRKRFGELAFAIEAPQWITIVAEQKRNEDEPKTVRTRAE